MVSQSKCDLLHNKERAMSSNSHGHMRCRDHEFAVPGRMDFAMNRLSNVCVILCRGEHTLHD